MNKAIILFFIMMTATLCYAGTLVVKTGYGYYKYQGQPIMMYEFPPGNYTLESSLEAVEVADRSALDLVQLNSQAMNAYQHSIGK